jgi:hypothetical protein
MQNQTPTNKAILFFSNYCDHSKELLGLIIKKNIKANFVLVCVDNTKYRLPDFVDRVPIIYTSTGDILYDDILFKYVESSASTEDIAPFAISTSINYSDQYSYLDDTIDNENKAYTTLGRDHHISNIVEENNENQKKGFDNSMFDKYMQMREEDDSRIKRNMNNGENYGRL